MIVRFFSCRQVRSLPDNSKVRWALKVENAGFREVAGEIVGYGVVMSAQTTLPPPGPGGW